MSDPSGITPDNLPAFQALLTERLRFPLGYAMQGGDPAAWRDRTLAVVRGLILPDLAEGPVQVTVLAEEDRGDHLAQRLTLELAGGLVVPALVLLPKGTGPFPAVLALHDHGSRFDIGKEKCIPPLDPARRDVEWARRFYGGQPIGTVLVRRGYVVLCADALGWGDREGQGYGAQQALAANLMNLGITLAGLMAWEDTRAAEALAGLPQVDPGRIAAVGFSMGAFRAWQVAALSPAISAAVASCWMAGLKGLMVPGNNHLRGQSAFYMTHPLLARHLDLPDLASLAAPKPLLLQAGAEDHLFPPAAVADAFATLRGVWRAWGAEDLLETQLWPGGHSFGTDRQASAFDWLDREALRSGEILR